MAVGLRRFSKNFIFGTFFPFHTNPINYSYRAGGKIKNLTIVNCNVEKLYGDIFRTNKITKLVIKDTPIRFFNRKLDIKYKIIFREIRNDTFIGLEESLEELILENSRLEHLPVVSSTFVVTHYRFLNNGY